MANPIDIEQLKAETMEDEDNPDFEPGEDEEEEVSITKFVKKDGW
jgi:hypothetical protein